MASPLFVAIVCDQTWWERILSITQIRLGAIRCEVRVIMSILALTYTCIHRSAWDTHVSIQTGWCTPSLGVSRYLKTMLESVPMVRIVVVQMRVVVSFLSHFTGTASHLYTVCAVSRIQSAQLYASRVHCHVLLVYQSVCGGVSRWRPCKAFYAPQI